MLSQPNTVRSYLVPRFLLLASINTVAQTVTVLWRVRPRSLRPNFQRIAEVQVVCSVMIMSLPNSSKLHKYELIPQLNK